MAKNFLYAPLGGGPGDRDALAAAAALAGVFDADVEAVFLGVDDAAVLMMAGDGFSGIGVTAVEALREERGRAEAAARSVAAEFGIEVDSFKGRRANATAPARLAALAVIDPEAARGQGPLADVLEALLLEDGAPVLIPRCAPPYRRLAMAWDGSREASRALKAAGPLVAAAEEVCIVQVTGAVEAKDFGAADPDRAIHWIELRNPNVRVEIVSVEGDPARVILPAVKHSGADLLVAGAYGHARLREAMFGGVTRSLLLAHAPSILLVH